MRTQDLLYWQLSHVYSSVNYSNHAVYYINSNYLFYNWKFVPFDHLHLIPPIPIPALVTTNLIYFSVSMFVFEV